MTKFDIRMAVMKDTDLGDRVEGYLLSEFVGVVKIKVFHRKLPWWKFAANAKYRRRTRDKVKFLLCDSIPAGVILEIY